MNLCSSCGGHRVCMKIYSPARMNSTLLLPHNSLHLLSIDQRATCRLPIIATFSSILYPSHSASIPHSIQLRCLTMRWPASIEITRIRSGDGKVRQSSTCDAQKKRTLTGATFTHTQHFPKAGDSVTFECTRRLESQTETAAKAHMSVTVEIGVGALVPACDQGTYLA